MESRICLNCMYIKNEENDICDICGAASVEEANEPWHLKPGIVIKKRYLVGASIGYGGFGVTYVAMDLTLQLKVAIKEYLPSEFATRMPGMTKVSVYGGEKVERYQHGLIGFMNEARKLAKLTKHPGIVRIHDFFEENETAYIVTEYVEGITLKEYLSSKGKKIAFDKALTILMPIIETLCEVHKTGIIHRDISPDNILMTKNNKIKLIDFGAARYATTGHTKSLSVILKPGYAPEEQYRTKGKQGPWSDIYAVGATLYKMITGMVPEEALERIVEDKLAAPSKLGIKLPENAEIALMNALAIKAYNRYQTMEQFREYIAGNQVATIINKDVIEKVSRTKRSRRLIVGSIIVILAIISVFYFNSNQNLQETVKYLNDVNKVNVPDIIGKTKEDGKNILDGKELEFVIVDKQNSDKVIEDRIMVQTPKSGKLSDRGVTIEVVISAGKQSISDNDKVKVADMQYKTVLEAITVFEGQGLTVQVIYELNEDVEEGRVIEQSIEPGTMIKEGMSIVLKVSLGKTDDIISFDDVELENTISKIVGKAIGSINKGDVNGIRVLDASNSQLETITGLRYFVNLEKLILNDNHIKDLSPVSRLYNLYMIELRNNKIEDISPLKRLKNIEKLNLTSNNISDISGLSNLTKISTLYLDNNTISDISALKNLNSLRTLRLRNNQIKDIHSLAKLSFLEELLLSDNAISDIRYIGSLNNLSKLDISNNHISDITPIDGNTNFKEIDISGNSISDYSAISDLTNLMRIEIDGDGDKNDFEYLGYKPGEYDKSKY